MKHLWIIVVFILGLAVGYLFHRLTINSPQQEGIDRNLVWGEHYFDPTDESVAALNLLDVPGLEKLFGSAFDQGTPISINHHTSLNYCQVPFGDQVYLLTAPLGVGSFGNTIFGYDFIIRDSRDPKRDTDFSFSIIFDVNRRIRSVAFRDGIFGSTRQVHVTAGMAATELASAVRREMMRAMGGDGNKDKYWSYMPNFMEKLIVAIDNHIIRAPGAESGDRE